MRNKLILQPKDYLVMHSGLKLENVGEWVIEMELPINISIYPSKQPELKSIELSTPPQSEKGEGR